MALTCGYWGDVTVGVALTCGYWGDVTVGVALACGCWGDVTEGVALACGCWGDVLFCAVSAICQVSREEAKVVGTEDSGDEKGERILDLSTVKECVRL